MGNRTQVGFGRRLSWSLGVTVLSTILTAQPARAEVSPADQAAAEVLFREAQRLLGENKLDQACPKFAESQRLDPAPGTLLNLGDCEERRGNLASAYGAFLEARVQAEHEGDQKGRGPEAVRRAKLLEPRLSMLVINVGTESEIAGIELRRDGRAIGRGLWGTGIPVDPGAHTVEASAPGHKPWSATVKVEGKPGEVAVVVPPLAPADTAKAPPAPSTLPADALAKEASAWSTQRTLGLGALGLGGVGVVLGSIFGAQALGKASESKGLCKLDATPIRCTQPGLDLRAAGLTAANVSNVAFAVGGAAIVGGVVLLLTGRSPEEANLRAARRLEVSPVFGLTAAGISASGQW